MPQQQPQQREQQPEGHSKARRKPEVVDLGDGSVAGVRSEQLQHPQHAVSWAGAVGRVVNALRDTVADDVVI